jgi:ATP-binding cassette subfamily B (MDR/TAP) protein 1
MKGYTEKYRAANEDANQVASEAIGNIRTVASFTREEATVTIFVAKMAAPMKLGVKNAIVRGFMTGLGQLFLMCSYTLSLWYGGKLIDDGEYTFLQVMKVFMAIIMCAMGKLC